MSQKYPGGFITKSPPAPTSSAASGMWTLDQAMQLKKQGNWPPLAIGAAFGGGYYAGQIGVSGVATHNLVVGPVSSAQSSSKQFKTSNTDDPGATSFINGPANSSSMNDADHPAAQFCEAVTAGGFTDWYMPARNELEVCYYNLKPTTDSNIAGSGSNSNAVPTHGNYTSGTPAQTSAAIFVTGTGSEAFTAAYYWSSTQRSATFAYRQRFSDGYQYSYGSSKTGSFNVRAIRRVAV